MCMNMRAEMELVSPILRTVLLLYAFNTIDNSLGIEVIVKGLSSNYFETTIVPVIDIAVERIHTMVDHGKYMNFSIVFHHYSYPCEHVYPTLGASLAAKYYHTKKVAAFMGPACNSAMENVAILCAAWNLPVLSGMSPGFMLGDKEKFHTLTRTSSLAEHFARAVEAAMHYFNWHMIIWINQSEEGYYGAITEGLRDHHAELFKEGFDFVEIKSWEFDDTKDILVHAMTKGRGKLSTCANKKK